MSHKKKTSIKKKLSKGGVLVGATHEEGGIKIATPEGEIEAEGDEIIINAKSSRKYREVLSEINQAEGGVAIPASAFEKHPESEIGVYELGGAINTVVGGSVDRWDARESVLGELKAEKKSLLEQKETEKDYSKKTKIWWRIKEIDIAIRYYDNLIIAFLNGGTAIQFSDKRDVLHQGIPDFTRIKTDFILFDEDTVLVENVPPYIPLIDEDIFRQKGYVFDAIRIDKDKYILATNGYNERVGTHSIADRMKHEGLPNEGTSHPSDIEQGYVLVTLDQLVLINDFYYAKAKAINQKEADDRNRRQEEYYDKLPRERRERHMSQSNMYNGLPVKVKKLFPLTSWESMTLEEKESHYKPIKRYGAKRLTSKLGEHTMWVSFHEMYERFINPEALPFSKKDGIVSPVPITKRRVGVYGHSEVFSYWGAFVEMMDWKLNDLQVQRQIDSDIRKLALETSFGESNTNDILKSQYGILVKRQNGSAIQPTEIEQIREAWVVVQSKFGELSDIAFQDNLKISHTAERHVFASKAIGMYLPKMKTVAVSGKYGRQSFQTTMAHEVAHYIDNRIGETRGERYSTDNYEGEGGILASTFRKLTNAKSDSKYLNATKECFARAMEQHFAVSVFGNGATLINSPETYFEHDNYVSKENYDNTIRPLVEHFLTKEQAFFRALVQQPSKTIQMENYYIKTDNILVDKIDGTKYKISSINDGGVTFLKHSAIQSDSREYNMAFFVLVEKMDSKQIEIENCPYETDRDKALLKNEIANITDKAESIQALEAVKTEMNDAIVNTTVDKIGKVGELKRLRSQIAEQTDTIDGLGVLTEKKYGSGGKVGDEKHIKKTADSLVGGYLYMHILGVHEAVVSKIKAVRVTDKKFDKRFVTIELQGGGEEKINLEDLSKLANGVGDVESQMDSKEPVALEFHRIKGYKKGGKVNLSGRFGPVKNGFKKTRDFIEVNNWERFKKLYEPYGNVQIESDSDKYIIGMKGRVHGYFDMADNKGGWSTEGIIMPKVYKKGGKVKGKKKSNKKKSKKLKGGKVSQSAVSNFAQFEKIVRKSKSFEEAFKKAGKIKGVPSDVANEFYAKYNPDEKLSPKQSFEKFYNEIKNN